MSVHCRIDRPTMDEKQKTTFALGMVWYDCVYLTFSKITNSNGNEGTT